MARMKDKLIEALEFQDAVEVDFESQEKEPIEASKADWDAHYQAMEEFDREVNEAFAKARKYERIADLTLKIMAGAASFGLGIMIAGVFV